MRAWPLQGTKIPVRARTLSLGSPISIFLGFRPGLTCGQHLLHEAEAFQRPPADDGVGRGEGGASSGGSGTMLSSAMRSLARALRGPRTAVRTATEYGTVGTVLYICLRLTYRREFFRRMVPDPYIFGTAGAPGFHWCFVRLQQSSFRLFIARSIISTLSVSPYGGLK